jgi:hypothetical protein
MMLPTNVLAHDGSDRDAATPALALAPRDPAGVPRSADLPVLV